jgi:hypothetical protein
MRKTVATLLLSLISLSAAAQKTPSDSQATAAPKPAWEWTLDERIAKRLDPASIRERALENEKDLVERGGFRPEEIVPVRFVVEGRRDPELLMPFELLGSILHGVAEMEERETRSIYGPKIIESGWDEVFFWQTLEEASAEYTKTQRERLTAPRQARLLPRSERYSIASNSDSEGLHECGLRVEALKLIRQKLGSVKFDRFLYENVAPNVSISSDFPLANEEWRLRHIEGGCR